MSWSYFTRRKARRLPTIAKWINENTDHTAIIGIGHCNTDRDIPGTRLRHPGKGRWGNKLIVKTPKGAIAFEHNAAETYRMNYEVELWIENYFGITTIDQEDSTNFNQIVPVKEQEDGS